MNDAPTRKYMFDLSFDDASVVHRAQERKPVLMKPEQIDALKKEAFDAGFEAGKAAGKEQQTAQLHALIATVDRNIGALLKNLANVEKEQDGIIRSIVVAIARKILPDFAARNGLAEIEAVLADALREMAREPRLVIRVHESQLDAVNERAQALAAQRAYPGKLIVLADDNIAAGDCRIEWADGGVERNTQTLMDSVEQTVNPTSPPSA
jgi:flagellar assembly protein FliH